MSAQGNDLPLWKRMVHPDLPGLFFIGLLQPLGAVMPIVGGAERAGRRPPDRGTTPCLPDSELRAARWLADDAAYKKRFYASARHTMEVDFDHYLWELDRERQRGATRALTNDGARRMSTGGALVTGAGSGLGREIALRLGGLGYTVHVTDVDDVAGRGRRRRRSATARSHRRTTSATPRQPRDLAALTVEKAGSLALWVNNAGVLFTGPMWEQSHETRQLMFDVNVLGTSHGMAAALKVMNAAGERAHRQHRLARRPLGGARRGGLRRRRSTP